MPVRICLNMIVKNEAARIERALKSAAPYITGYVITDTGSTDNTIEVIEKFFAERKIPGRVTKAPFENWSQARNAALRAARMKSAEWDYLLLMDADMELCVEDRAPLNAMIGPSYDVYQRVGSTVYQNRRFLSAHATGNYLGVTHEYLDVDSAGCLSRDKVFFVDHADGANRPNKYKRDIRLLRDGLKDEPNNSRYFYYIAQSYRDAGDIKNAAKWYKKRVDACGWEEEQWHAQVQYAECLRALKDDAGYVFNMMKAYSMRPQRAETPYQLSNYFRHKDMHAPSVAFAEAALGVPKTEDGLFVNEYAYGVGPLEELSICGFYVPGKREKAFQITDHLSITPGPFEGPRATARQNMFWYLPLLGELCPTFKWQKIGLEPPDGYTAMNPSVTLHKGEIRAVVRTVNYKIDDAGRYLIRGTDGTANATNPIHTRNFLVHFNPHSLAYTPSGQVELLPPGNWPSPPKFPLVVGFEDMRLFSRQGQLQMSATVRELHEDGNCEQVLAPIEQRVGGTFVSSDWKRMLREPRETQKNWMPIADHGTFMYRLGEVVDSDGKTLVKHETGLSVDRISGGSQVIDYGDKWLAVVHEAQLSPGSTKRYYYHRFALFDADFRLLKLSRPFCFNEKVIEFCAGMCWHPDGEHLVFSYGFQDAEARIATIHSDDIEKLLCQTSKS